MPVLLNPSQLQGEHRSRVFIGGRMNYAVFDEGKTRRGDAKKILEDIRSEHAPLNDELKAMSVDDYADALIEDAPYFLADELKKAIDEELQGSNKYDVALAYLAAMPTSGIRILTSA